MNSAMISRRSIGVNFHSDAPPTILVWAPHASKLSVIINSKEEIALQKMQYGYWQASLLGLKPGDKYLLQINGKDSFPDPASLYQPDGVHKASEVVDLSEIKNIHYNSWTGIDKKDLVIYELHVGTFTPEGTFNGVEKKLNYLKQLGINAIKVMPVSAFPGNRNWGYDGVFPFATQNSYGGPLEFAKLIKACHEKDIAVILDVVYNHLGPEGNYLNAFGPYFTDKYKTPWGKAINFDDAWSDGVRHYFIENALMWLRDFHIDGLRLDAVHAIKDFSPRHFLSELSEHVQKLNLETGANHFLIGECDLNDTRFINPLNKNGYGLDAQWCDEWHHALHALTTGERNGYYSDFGKLGHLTKSFNHGYVYCGNYSEHRKKLFGTPTTGLTGEKFVIFTQNHDQVGNRMLGERLSNLVDFETLKLAAGAMFISPFIPMIFMGEEYAGDSPFLYFISHGDEHLVEQVRKGRKREFRDFMKNASPPDPFAEETFQKSKLKWDFQDDKQKEQMLAFYKKCIRLKKDYPLLKPGNRENVYAQEIIKDKVMLYTRYNGRKKIAAFLNFSEQPVRIETDEFTQAQPELLLYSSLKKWGGNVPDDESSLLYSQDNSTINIERKSIAVFMTD